MKRVLILDANQRSALATTRSLGKRGVPVFTSDETLSALAGCSRYSEQYLTYPSPRTRPDEFVREIEDFVKLKDIDIILPMTELTTGLLLQARERFSQAILPFAELASVDMLSDKCALIRMANSLGIPAPPTRFFDTTENISKYLDHVTYPQILKPGKSWQQIKNTWQRAAVRIADTPEKARHYLKTDPAFSASPFMLQEFIHGVGGGVFALYDQGNPIVFFSHRRLREKPPSGGVSVLSESIAVDPVLQSYSESLLNAVNWHGIAMVEFKIADDGTPYLMEINTRFWGSLQLAIDSGVDFPWLLYQIACGKRVEPFSEYKIGRRLRWVLGDLDSLYLIVKDSKINFRAKLIAVGRFLKPSFGRTKHEVNRWGDPGPFWCEIKHYIRDLFA